MTRMNPSLSPTKPHSCDSMSSLDTAPLLNSSKWLIKALFQESSPRFLHLNVQAVCMERLTRSHGGCTRLIQKSNLPPYQELWSALINLNPLFRDLCPLQKDNQPSERTAVPQCLWMTLVTSLMSTCTITEQQMKQSTRNTCSNVWPSNTGSKSFTTIVIMEGSQTRLLWMMSGWHT